jgi:hypothetical protein
MLLISMRASATRDERCAAHAALGINDAGLVVVAGVAPNDLAHNIGLVYDTKTGTMTSVDAPAGCQRCGELRGQQQRLCRWHQHVRSGLRQLLPLVGQRRHGVDRAAARLTSSILHMNTFATARARIATCPASG